MVLVLLRSPATRQITTILPVKQSEPVRCNTAGNTLVDALPVDFPVDETAIALPAAAALNQRPKLACQRAAYGSVKAKRSVKSGLTNQKRRRAHAFGQERQRAIEAAALANYYAGIRSLEGSLGEHFAQNHTKRHALAKH